MAPHIYREQEIVELPAAARQLGAPGGLRPTMIETLFDSWVTTMMLVVWRAR
ncbi:MAG: hypothetical protein IH627_05530 [Rubrivivax sp.]|nr:hypothetical protein [Rubrivivax sp.]